VISRLAGWWRTHRSAALAAAAVAGAVVIATAFIWPITDLIAAHDVGRIASRLRAEHLQTAREAVRTQLLTLAAGVFVAGALWFTAQNFRLSRQGQVTDRYTKAIEQLGSDKLDVRIGAAYALERIARDSARDHPTVMEVLAAFIREHSREQWPPAEDGAEPPERTTRPDVQAAVTVIGRRTVRYGSEHIDLSDVDLTGANLTGANLIDARLTRAYLTGAHLTGADLTRAWLIGADLTGAFLTDARLPGAYLTGADLPGAYLTGADLTGADLGSANLTGADLGSADLTGANFTRADLTRANLTGALRPPAATVPQGWQRDTDSGRLKRADTGSGGDAA
jgi:Pentapeptide repeats (8 copies)